MNSMHGYLWCTHWTMQKVGLGEITTSQESRGRHTFRTKGLMSSMQCLVQALEDAKVGLGEITTSQRGRTHFKKQRVDEFNT